MSRPSYCSREDAKSAVDSTETARNNAQIDRLIEAASRDIDRLTARHFYPMIQTVTMDWPNNQMGRSWRIWLDRQEVISVTTLVTGNITIPPAAIILQPGNTGPPFSRIELNLGMAAAFGGNAITPQNAVSITGVFGYTNATTSAGTLTAAISSTTATTCSISDAALVGVGDTILIDSEYLQVTDKRMADTGQTGSLASSSAAVTLAVSSGAAFDIGEVLLIESERLLVVDIAGNNLTVKRAWDGTVLAAHTSAGIFAARTLTVTRGTLGTTAATHSNAAPVLRHTPPALIRQLCIAETINSLQQEGSAYQAVQQRSRNLGASGSARGAMTQVYPIDDLRNRVMTAYGRQSRLRVI